MEVIDQDVQMVRDALKDAPEYVKMHFENIVEQHAMEAAKAEEVDTLKDRVDELESELKDAKEESASLQEDLEARDDGMVGALETVKYWMHDALILHKPMSDPRKILRTVEDALR